MTASQRPEHEVPRGSQWRAGIAVLLVLIGVSCLGNILAIPRIAKLSRRPSPAMLQTGGSFAGAPDLREIVADESLEELLSHLYEEYAYWIMPPLNGGRLVQVVDLEDVEDVLRSPRTSKLVAILSLLPRGEALARSRAICETTRRRWSETFDVVLTSYERPGAPKNQQPIRGVKGAYGTAIFALAHFAGVSEVVTEVRRCTDLQDQYKTRIQNDRDVISHGGDLVRMFCLDANFRINAIALAFEHGPGSDPTPNPTVTELLGGLPTHRLAYRRWDAPTPPPRLSTSYPYLPVDPALAAQGCVELDIHYRTRSPDFQRDGERILRNLMQLCAD